MKSCIIIDDEQSARDALKKVITLYFADKLKIHYIANSLQEGVEAIKKYRPEIIFLDVEMPNQNGFELFKYFEEDAFHIIFTTGYDKYAIKAIKHSAVDYLLKPITNIDLADALQRISKKEQTKTNTAFKVEELLNNLNFDTNNFNKIALPTSTGFVFEKTRNIIYCKSNGNYTNIFILNKPTLLISKSLKEIESILPENVFFRIHKSYLVNLNYVKSINKTNACKLILETGDILPVSSRKEKQLINTIKG